MAQVLTAIECPDFPARGIPLRDLLAAWEVARAAHATCRAAVTAWADAWRECARNEEAKGGKHREQRPDRRPLRRYRHLCIHRADSNMAVPACASVREVSVLDTTRHPELATCPMCKQAEAQIERE